MRNHTRPSDRADDYVEPSYKRCELARVNGDHIGVRVVGRGARGRPGVADKRLRGLALISVNICAFDVL
jgi:hypothetical protein